MPYPSVMPSRVPDKTQGEVPDEDPIARFARVIRTAREGRGWTQVDLERESGVSRPTIQRYENAKTGTPQPSEARRIFRALGLNPLLIPVILGYVTAEEMDLRDTAPQVLTPTAEEALRILQDPNVPAASKSEWLSFLKYRVQQDALEAAAREREAG